MSSRAYGQLELNPGAQEAFVHNEHLYSAYIGGVGSGKTYAGFARALKYAMQTKPEGQFHGPRVTVAAATYPLLMDAVVPPAQEILALTGVADWDKSFKKQKKELHLPNGGTILFRSLDDPDTVMRGPELAGVFIDEGRNVSLYHWKLVTGRLRQKGLVRQHTRTSTFRLSTLRRWRTPGRDASTSRRSSAASLEWLKAVCSRTGTQRRSSRPT